MYELRPYQKIAMDNIKKFIDGPEGASIVVLPTGAGKSLCIAETAIYIDSPLIVLQYSKEILKQNYEKYISYGFKAEIFSASLKSRKIGRVTFATIGSIVNNVEDFKMMGVKHICLDECDFAAKTSNQIGQFIKALKVKKVIGFTATPLNLSNTMAGSTLKMLNETRGSIFKNICHITQCHQMVIEKFWTPIDYRSVNVNTSMLKLNTTQNDYTQESLNEYLEQNNISKHIYHYCEKLEKAKHILVFVDSINYAEEMAAKIPNAACIHSKLSISERDEKIAGFRSGKYRVAINVGILAVGFDFPKLQVIIHARPTNSLRIWYQTIGRIVRIHPDKPICLVVDLSGNLAKFGKIEELKFVHHPEFGWYLRNKDRNLTTNPRIEAYKTTKRLASSAKDYIVMFGKYKDKKKTIADIYNEDKRYLEWIAFGEFSPFTPDAIKLKEMAQVYLK